MRFMKVVLGGVILKIMSIMSWRVLEVTSCPRQVLTKIITNNFIRGPIRNGANPGFRLFHLYIFYLGILYDRDVKLSLT